LVVWRNVFGKFDFGKKDFKKLFVKCERKNAGKIRKQKMWEKNHAAKTKKKSLLTEKQTE
jgi:hypothetical protein